MGKHSATSVPRRAAGSLVAAGAVPLIATLIGTGTADAELLTTPPALPSMIPALPTGLLPPVPAPAGDLPAVTPGTVGEATRATVRAVTDTLAAAAEPFIRPAPATSVPVIPPQVPVTEPASGARPLPDHPYLAPLATLHAPVPVTPVAPIEAPPGTLRIGTLMMSVPFDAGPVNEGAAQAEAQVATLFDSMGVERSRADRIAAQTVGSAVVGAAVANAVVAPVAIPFAMAGAAAGFVAGIPFLPTGLVIGPVLGAAIGYGVVAVPAMLAGAALGGAYGATDGFTAASFGTPPR